MTLHAKLLRSYLALGYPETEGICHGFSIRWLEASILNQGDAFDGRLKIIIDNGTQLTNLLHKAEKRKWAGVTKKGKHLLFDIRAFFDSLFLFQSPHEHASVFGAHLGQSDEDTLSTFASSDAMQSRGGLRRIYSEPGIYTQEELEKYLSDLGEALEASESKDVIGMLLSSYDHTIALTYNPDSDQKWCLMDINQHPSSSFKPEETSALAEKIAQGLNLLPEYTYSTFNARIFTTGKKPLSSRLEEELTKFKSTHTLTEEIASRVENEINLVYIAAQNGRADVIAELARLGADLNKADASGLTPAYIAAQYGHVDVIAALARFDVDLNKANADGVTPAYIAAQQGHADVIKELAKCDGVDLNKANADGATPAFIAAYMGHADVIAVLASFGVDLSEADTGGVTPAYIAAQYGHAEVIKELASFGANLNQADAGGATPAFIAAYMGHADVIKELASLGANLNQAEDGGATPAHIAAYKGHANVIKALAERDDVDLNNVNADGTTPAHIAAKMGRADVIKELAKSRRADLNKARADGLTPAHIAAQKGLADVIVALAEHGVDFNTPFKSSSKSLKELASKHGHDVIARMDAFLEHKADGDISVLPRDIAVVVGHERVSLLLDRAMERRAPPTSAFFSPPPLPPRTIEPGTGTRPLPMSP